LRVIDYKSGSKKFDLTELYYGLQVQLEVYLAAAMRQAAAETGIEPLPAGMFYFHVSDPFLERAVIQRKIALELINRDTILLHGSTVGADGNAYLFTAPCGTGKSTHTRLWREVFGDRAVMVNDDKAFLTITQDGVFAYGSPWSGKHGLDTNVCLPLKGICFLSRGVENRIIRADVESCMDELIHQTLVPEEPDGRGKAIALVKRLSGMVPLWQMECTKDSYAAILSHKVMSENHI
jgi:hypothetical protein